MRTGRHNAWKQSSVVLGTTGSQSMVAAAAVTWNQMVSLQVNVHGMGDGNLLFPMFPSPSRPNGTGM